MLRLFNCLTNQHDWRFVLLAAVVCAGGIATALVLIGLGKHASRRGQRLYSLSGAMVLALSIWATHFIAMVGYESGVTVSYAPWGTLASLAIAVLGLTTCVFLARGGASRGRRIVGGLTAVTSIAAMHFVGVAAVTMAGARVVYHPLSLIHI